MTALLRFCIHVKEDDGVECITPDQRCQVRGYIPRAKTCGKNRRLNTGWFGGMEPGRGREKDLLANWGLCVRIGGDLQRKCGFGSMIEMGLGRCDLEQWQSG